jgi:hypothetical protein
MKALVTTRVNRLAGTLAELKVKVRTALATELAGAVGTAVRDLLVVALIDRLIANPVRSERWRDDRYDRDAWGEPRDPWADADDFEDRTPSRYARDEEEAPERRALPAAAALAVGVNVGRWWLARKGSVACAFGLGAAAAAAALGLAGGPVAQALIAVIAAATDVLTAESALARPDSF